MPASAGRRVLLGGRFSLRAYVQEEEPYRPEVALWVEQDTGLVRGVHLARPPLGRAAIAASLEQAITAPLAGTPGEPHLVRVADVEIAEIARSVLSPGVAVEVGPVDELEAVAAQLDRMAEQGPPPEATPRKGSSHRGRTGGDGEGYLAGGRVRPEVVASLFAASARLVEEAPWQQMSDSAVLAVDVPSLGVAGACLSVIGALEKNLGYVLFDSAGSYEAFLALADRMGADDGPRPRIRGYLHSLNLVRWQELPAPMRREASAHGWSVATPRGYPELICLDADGVPRPHAERDYVLAAVCAAALAELCASSDGDLDPPRWPPVTRRCTAVVAGTKVEVSLTLPHPGAAEFADLGAPPPPVASAPLADPPTPPSHAAPSPVQRAMPRVGRNEPCPCGSGRKFKRCHGGGPAPDSGERRADERAERAKHWHDRDGRLIGEMFEVAKLRFPVEWLEVAEAADGLVKDRMGPQILTPWMAYHARLRDRPLAEWFLQMRGSYLVRADRAWLEAARSAWMSVWEVIDVEPGQTIALRDVLTGEERVVVEASASRGIARFEAVLARIVSIDDLSLLCGMHSRVLGPRAADDLVQAVRQRLRLRSKTVAIERMRTEQTTVALLRAWERVVAAETKRVAAREVRNTEGHRLLLTTDRYRFARACRAEVVERLETIAEPDDVADPGPDGAQATVRLAIARPADFRKTVLDTVTVCHLQVQRDVLLVATNSRERADEMRALVERTCGGLVEHAGRSHADPTSSALRRAERDPDPMADDAPPPEVAEHLVSLKRRHYEAWLDPEPRRPHAARGVADAGWATAARHPAARDRDGRGAVARRAEARRLGALARARRRPATLKRRARVRTVGSS